MARNIAEQLERRVAFRRAMKQAVQRSMQRGAKGVKIAVAGRLGGAEMGAASGTSEAASRCTRCAPTSTTARCDAHTTFGRIGVKVWIYRGDILPERAARRTAERAAAGSRTRESRRMLQPKRVKHRKVTRGRMPELAKGGNTVAFGEFGTPGNRRLDRQPPDRGRPARDDARGQARWQGLDPHLPGQARDQEAGRDAHGLGQGRARPLGRGRQARSHAVRDRPA